MVLFMVILYLLAMVYIGFLYRKSASSSEEGFLVANRSIPTWLGGGALASTYTSTSGFLGILGLMYTAGLAPALWGNVGLLLGFILAMVFVAPQLRKAEIVTFPQYFEKRFNKRVRAVAGLVTLVTMFVYMIAQIQGGAYAMQFVLGIPYEVAVVVIGVVFIIYVVLGGTFASVVTSFWQNLMMVAAMLILAFLAIFTLDWDQTVSTAVSIKPVTLNSWGGPGPIFSLSFGLLLALGVLSAPHVSVRYAAAKDEKTAVKTTTSAIAYLSIFYLATIFVGIYLISQFPDLTNPDMGYFMIVEDAFPKILVGLFVATVIAAAMSTTDAQLITAASAVTNDLYPILFKRQISQEKAIKVTRWLVIIIGALVVLVTLRPPQLIFLVMALAQSLMVGAFLVPLILGLWWKKATAHGALVGMIGGFLVSALTHPSLELVALPSPFLPGPIGALAALILTVTVSLLQKNASIGTNNRSKKEVV